MPLLTLTNVSLAYGHVPLLEQVNLRISKGERVCLIGRNGTGKSTLFRVIYGDATPDDGEVWHPDTLRISYLEQEVMQEASDSVYEIVARGLGELGQLIIDYHNATQAVSNTNDAHMDSLSDLQHRIELVDGWNMAQKIDAVLSRLSLPADKNFHDCSGGIRRRIMLAQALVSEPDLLILDEPTNHMDIEAITWLEEFLMNYQGALMFITHDRTFLKHLATCIIELDRGRLTSFNVNYDTYLQKKEEILKSEDRANAKFDKKLSEEEVWVRKGIKARRTRNEGRVRALQEMRRIRNQRISMQGKVKMTVDSGEISGKLVADVRDISFHYDELCIIKNFSTRIMRGDRVGIVGPNGSGKSTLLRILLGNLKPGSGKVISGTKLQLAYFDQQRSVLDAEKTVRENLSDGRDFIQVKGRPRHVISYLKDFLFPAERIDSPVKSLSGGERNRLVLAQIFALPTNLMVLDEPTNDLDVDTLELLEDLIIDYDGTLLLVSHDRAFLDNVVTSTLVFEGDGTINEYVGGYEDWIRQRKLDPDKTTAATGEKSAGKKQTAVNTGGVNKRKLSFNETRELASLPEKIQALESEQQSIEDEIANSEFYKKEKSAITATLSRLDQIKTDLQLAYERWEALDNIS